MEFKTGNLILRWKGLDGRVLRGVVLCDVYDSGNGNVDDGVCLVQKWG